MNGNDIIIYMGNQAIGATKSDKVQLKCDTQAISSPMLSEWKRRKAKRMEWSLSTTWLVMSQGDVSLRSLVVGTEVTISVQYRTGTVIYSGKAICTKADMKFTVGSLAVGSWNFVGNGKLNITL